MGIDYMVRAIKGVEEIYVGAGHVLAKLSLPSRVSATQHQFVLHPSIIDAALQAAVGLTPDLNDFNLALPFALEELEVCGPCTSRMWTLIRYSDGSSSLDAIQKLDVDLCDEQGTICVRMRGFSFRVLKGAPEPGHQQDAASSERAVGPSVGLTMMSSVWNPVPLVGAESSLAHGNGSACPEPHRESGESSGGSTAQRNAVQKLYPGCKTK